MKVIGTWTGRTIRQADSERAVGLFELVIALPLLFSLFFLLFHYPQYLNNVSSLRTAMSTGMRLAVTRGNNNLTGMSRVTSGGDTRAGMIDPINQLSDLGSVSRTACENAKLCRGDDLVSPETKLNETFSDELGIDANQVPTTYLYALFYTLETMERLSGTLRHPCDPNEPNNGGCMQCRFLEHPANDENEDGIVSPAEIRPNVFRMRCEFRPRSAFYEIGTRFAGAGNGIGVYRLTLSIPPTENDS